MLDLERVERAYRALIGREDTFMGSKILNAEVNGEALFSPFEKKRTQDPYFDGFTDRSEFLDDVIVEEKKTEETIDPASKNVDDMLVDESDYVTTKRIVIKREDSVLDNNKGYLIISAIIVMTLAAIMVILCVANRCGKKKVLTIAETVR